MHGPRPNLAELTGVGTILTEKYRIERVVGAGGMGAVAMAHHLKLGSRVAIKFLLPRGDDQARFAARFLREARAASRITGSHVARVFDVDVRDDGTPYIVMEFLDGETLARALARRGPLPLSESVDYLLEACEALAEAHALGIVHRDLKPENLFLTRGADRTRTLVKVLDFGISKTLQAGDLDSVVSATTGDAFIGSPPYMSPEQLTLPDGVDFRTDIWSLGVVLYECLTGCSPFAAATVGQTCALILQSEPAALGGARPDVPERLQRVVRCCLAKSKERRFDGVLALARELAEFGSEASRRSLAVIESLENLASSTPGWPEVEADAGTPPSTLTGLDTGSATVAHGEGAVPRAERARARMLLLGAALLVLFSVLGLTVGSAHGPPSTTALDRAAAGAFPSAALPRVGALSLERRGASSHRLTSSAAPARSAPLQSGSAQGAEFRAPFAPAQRKPPRALALPSRSAAMLSADSEVAPSGIRVNASEAATNSAPSAVDPESFFVDRK